MPFLLFNVGSNFCHLMKQCIGEQKCVTTLLYSDDICILPLDIDTKLDQIETVFSRSKKFHLKSYLMSSTFSSKCWVFRPCPFCEWHFSKSRNLHNQDKVDKYKNYPVYQNVKEFH